METLHKRLIRTTTIKRRRRYALPISYTYGAYCMQGSGLRGLRILMGDPWWQRGQSVLSILDEYEYIIAPIIFTFLAFFTRMYKIGLSPIVTWDEAQYVQIPYLGHTFRASKRGMDLTIKPALANSVPTT